MGETNAAYQSLKDWILQHQDVTEAAHRFGGTEFRVGGLEFMHSHGPSFLDIRLSKEDQAQVLADGKAVRHRFAPQAGWVSFRIHNDADIERAKGLVELAYHNAKNVNTLHDSRKSYRRSLEKLPPRLTDQKAEANCRFRECELLDHLSPFDFDSS